MNTNFDENYITENFKWSEFESGDGKPVPKKHEANVRELCENLEVLRAFLSEPLTITSGYRSKAHNKAVGGVENSQHLTAKASDIVAAQSTPGKVHGAIQYLIKHGRMKEGGLGKYNSFTHYDIRGYKARWR